MLLNVKKDYMIINFNNALDDELGVPRKTFARQNKLGFLLMELKNEMKINRGCSLSILFKKEGEELWKTIY